VELLDTILGGGGGRVLPQLSDQYGISADQARGALEKLVPNLASGVYQNASQSGGLESLLGALQKGQHGDYLDRPESLADEATRLDGNRILGHLLGSKDASRRVASEAAQSTGLDSGILKSLLPVAANLVMGALSKQTAANDNPLGSLLGDRGDLLSGLLGGGGSGTSAPTDVVGMLGRFLGK